MQHNILKHKNKITSISGLLIALGLIAHFIFANTTISNSAFKTTILQRLLSGL